MKYIIALLVLVMIAGCSDSATIVNKTETYSSAGYSTDLITIEHDGHKFVCMVGVGRGGILHHPECQCIVKEQSKCATM